MLYFMIWGEFTSLGLQESRGGFVHGYPDRPRLCICLLQPWCLLPETAGL